MAAVGSASAKWKTTFPSDSTRIACMPRLWPGRGTTERPAERGPAPDLFQAAGLCPRLPVLCGR